MKTQKTKKVLGIILAATVLFGVCAFATDSEDDPLISLSYIEEVLKPYINDLIKNNKQDVPVSSYQVVTLKKGELLTANEGTELILRGGVAKAIIGSNAAGGFTDVTGATDITNNMSLTANHLLICPRSDGRAVYAESDEVYIMIKGTYTIEQEAGI